MNDWLQKKGILAILLAALMISSIWTYFELSPSPVDTPTDVSIHLQPDYSVITTKDSILWPANTNIAQGAQAYFYVVEPFVQYTPQIDVSGATQLNLKGSATVDLMIQAVNEKQEVYWSKLMTEYPAQTLSLTDSNQPYRLNPIQVNLLDFNTQINTINTELNFTNAIYQLLIVTRVEYTGSVNTKTVSGTISSTLPITFQAVSFTIPQTVNSVSTSKIVLSNDVVSTTLLERLQTKPYPLISDFGIVLFILFLIYKNQKSMVQTKRQHRRFKEWITDGRVQTKDHVNINVYTLEGLVDLAIDLDKRVIFDPDKERYYVLEETIVYVFDPEKKIISEKSEKKQLGKILIESGELRAEQLEIGLVYQQKFNRQLGVSLMELGFIDEITLYSTLAAQANIRFVKIDANTLVIDPKWLEVFTLNQANALEAIPLGPKKDGKLVVMCANPFKPGVKDALVEIFKQDIDLVATLPSTIYKTIERWSHLDQVDNANQTQIDANFELSSEEKTRFIFGYKHGNIIMSLLVKASSIVGDTILAMVPDQELILQWLLRNKYIRSEYVHILLGIQQATLAMNRAECEALVLPSYLDILVKSKYLTQADVAWVQQIMEKEGLTLQEVLLMNYLISSETLSILEYFMTTLETVLSTDS